MSTVDTNAKSPYAGALAAAANFRAMFDNTAVGPEHVTAAILTAVESARPAARYVRPWRTYAMLAFAKLFPTSWVDALLGRVTGLTKAKLFGVQSPAQLATR